MAKSPAQKMANRRYRDKVYDQITVEVKKGKRDEYKTAAGVIGITFKDLIQNGVEEYIRNHAPQAAQQALQATLEPTRDTLTVDEKTALNNLNRLPVKVQKAVLKLIAEIGDSQPKGGD